MKRVALAALAVLLLSVSALAQTPNITGTITAASPCPGAGCVQLTNLQGFETVGVDVNGAWSGTLEFRIRVIGTTDWKPVQALVLSGETRTTTASSNGIYVLQVGGIEGVMVTATAWTSGSATVTLNAGTGLPPVIATSTNAPGGLTNAELRASPVPVDGSGSTQPVSASALPLPTGAATSANQTTGNSSVASIDTKTPALVSGRVPVDGSAVTQPVSGTFWQATQPVSAASLPLPSGAATSALQTSGNSSLSSIDGKLPATVAADRTTAAAPGAARLSDGSAFYKATTPSDTQPVSAAALPLPSGAATAAKQDTGNASVDLIARATGDIGADIVDKLIFPGVYNVDVSGAKAIYSTSSTPAADVPGLVVRNIPSGTQAVSGTVTANAGTGTMAVSAAQLPAALASGGGIKVEGVLGGVPVAAYQGGTTDLTPAEGWFVRLGDSNDQQALFDVFGRMTVSIDEQQAPWLRVAGATCTGCAKEGYPVQIGGVFNTTQPTVATGQVVEAQSTARGAQIVAPGVEGFQVSAASLPLPTGASTEATLTSGSQRAQLFDPGTSRSAAVKSGLIPADGTENQVIVGISPTGSLPGGVNVLGAVGVGGYAQANTGWTSATALNSTKSIVNGAASGSGVLMSSGLGVPAVLVHLMQTSTITAGAITFEVSYDTGNALWATIPADQVIDPTSTTQALISLPYTLQANTNKPFLILMRGATGLRLKLSTAITGTGSVTPQNLLMPYQPITQLATGSSVAVSSLPALPTGANVIGALSTNQSVNQSQTAGATTATGLGVATTGTQRVALSSELTYSASTALMTATAAGTGVFANICGNATTTVRVQRIRVSGTVATGAKYGDVIIKKTSAATSAGTATTLTNVPYDSTTGASTSTVKFYTVLGTPGASVGAIESVVMFLPITATPAATGTPIEFTWRDNDSEGPTLRGTAQCLELSFGTTTATAPTLTFSVKWTEK